MEDDPERPYSVCTIDDLIEKMNKQINDISEIFRVSNSDATVLLMKHRWNSELLQELLTEDKKKLLLESGLTDSNQDLSDSSCDDEFYDFFEDVDDDDDDVKISTPFCSHKFSKTYWSKYLEKHVFPVEKTLDTISCPHQNCGASVGRDTIEKLNVKDENMYDEYVLRTYLEKNKKQITQCPETSCSYFIEFHPRVDDDADQEYGLNVVCLCGHTFCWRCSLESHRPVTCNNASDWLMSIELERLSVSCNETPTRSNRLEGRRRTKKKKESCLDRWEAGEVSWVEAKSLLEALEESSDMVLRQGLMLIVQCRQFLKWSCVYDYMHLEHEESKKVFLRYLQDYGNALVQSYAETLEEETEKAFTTTLEEEVTCSRGNLSAVTSSIGNYFYNFSKALQNGLDAVEVKHCDDSSPCWFCDRCTYANTWLHKVCQMCCDESPVDKPSD